MIAPDEMAGDAGGISAAVPPVAESAFVLQRKAASKLTKAMRQWRVLAYMCLRTSMPLPRLGWALQRHVEFERQRGCGEGDDGLIQRELRSSCTEVPLPSPGVTGGVCV